ncbi:ribosome maturation factor RimM [Candidatus Doolittlea endobia]|uniref:ribosome maturation factor RimM n=1 Tax=Candidatus Doolittlea endobia TaxID=1778262 RepID=UPI00082B0616|nr:ribosome maturation factor RimM [Candidatus Doolittlea endobia]
MRKLPCSAAPIEPIVVGTIGSAYGIHGWLRVTSSTDKAENIFNYQPWFIKKTDGWWLIDLESWKRNNQALIIKLKDIEDRETATLLTNCEIVIDASQLPNLEGSGEYYWKDLLKCQVITVSNYHLGKVIDLIETGSNDILIVKANLKDAFGVQQRLIPFLDGQVIKRIDLATHVIEVDWDPSF